MHGDAQWASAILLLVAFLWSGAFAIHCKSRSLYEWQTSNHRHARAYLYDDVLQEAANSLGAKLAPVLQTRLYEVLRDDDKVRGLLWVALETDATDRVSFDLETASRNLAERVAWLARKVLEETAPEMPREGLLEIVSSVWEAETDVTALERHMARSALWYGMAVWLFAFGGLVAFSGLAHCVWRLPPTVCYIQAIPLCIVFVAALPVLGIARAAENAFSRIAAPYHHQEPPHRAETDERS